MKVALLGTGFVADYYITTLVNHPQVELAGAFDIDSERLRQFCDYYRVRPYADLDALLTDPEPEIVVNLTPPELHYELSFRALRHGKHVYCEKPLAMRFEEAKELVEFASERNLTLAGAPANALSAACRLAAETISSGKIGKPRLVYAEMEDGPVFRGKWQTWRSRSGAKWPGLHEFEVGCTLEHAGYALSWLTTLFGPVEKLTAFSALTFPAKGPGTDKVMLGPDFSVGCLVFRSGVVARLTSGLAAPRDRSLTVLGDEGTLTVGDLWDHRSAIFLEPAEGARKVSVRLADRFEGWLGKALPWKPAPGRRLAYPADAAKPVLPSFPSQIDFAAGIAAQVDAIRAGRQPEFGGSRALHVTELALALNNARDLEQPYVMKSSF
ncbi:Gfo/Idh/MocA family oxidoreductase [Chelativorans sp.]|uniref:Gfo/Idh/MocA family protein n=1 Tax=Chelativorans sp. TaxID=2203393 RepID=UPI0028128843|nr:Gfo/Idh/MocA family oxidoreductase [Chelativorans sp.]